MALTADAFCVFVCVAAILAKMDVTGRARHATGG